VIDPVEEASAKLRVVKIAAFRALSSTSYVQGPDQCCLSNWHYSEGQAIYRIVNELCDVDWKYNAKKLFLPPPLQPEFIDIIKAAEVKTK
jgi:hypothetical protein